MDVFALICFERPIKRESHGETPKRRTTVDVYLPKQLNPNVMSLLQTRLRKFTGTYVRARRLFNFFSTSGKLFAENYNQNSNTRKT